jgi:hypothetical protein
MCQQGLTGAVVALKAEDFPLMHFKAQLIDRSGFFEAAGGLVNCDYVCILLITSADIHIAHPRPCDRGWDEEAKILLFENAKL